MNEIERLKKRTRDQQEMMRQERQRQKLNPNENMDADIPNRLSSYDFWCSLCQEDFSAPAWKTRYHSDGSLIAVLRGQCPECGETAVRYVTHRDQDPYYQRSWKIRRQRNQYLIETLQAEQYGFRTHYGEPYGEFQKGLQREEEIALGVDRKAGLRGPSLKAKERIERFKHAGGY